MTPSAFPAVYRKRFFLRRNPAIRAEIASRDAELDCQRIVHLLACYEFPFDITRIDQRQAAAGIRLPKTCGLV